MSGNLDEPPAAFEESTSASIPLLPPWGDADILADLTQAEERPQSVRDVWVEITEVEDAEDAGAAGGVEVERYKRALQLMGHASKYCNVADVHKAQIALYFALLKLDSRANVRILWRFIRSISRAPLTLHAMEALVKNLPRPEITTVQGERVDFSVSCLTDIVVQQFARPDIARAIVRLPVRSPELREFVDSPRFHQLHRDCATASFVAGNLGRVFLHDAVVLRACDSAPSRTCIVVFIGHRGRSNEVHIAGLEIEEVQAARLTVRQCQMLDSRVSTASPPQYALRHMQRESHVTLTAPEVPITVAEIESFMPSSAFQVQFSVLPSRFQGQSLTPLPLAVRKEFANQHSAVAEARRRGCEIVLLPIALFSDETSGNRRGRGSMHESSSVTFLGMDFHARQLEKNSFILSTSAQITAMEQFLPLAPWLKELEDGVLAVDGANGQKAIVVAPIGALLGDNPRQATFCSNRGVQAHANCRVCE